MGHEVPRTPEQIESDKVFRRSLEIKEKIKDIPLGFFRVADLEPLVKLFARSGDWLNGGEVEQLETRFKEIESGEIAFDVHLRIQKK